MVNLVSAIKRCKIKNISFVKFDSFLADTNYQNKFVCKYHIKKALYKIQCVNKPLWTATP